jgi:ketosteroid isomerase-like protein
MLSREDVRRCCHQYAEAWNAGDVDAVVAMFSPHAVVREPIDGPAFDGLEAFRAFFESVRPVVESLTVVEPIYVSADCRHAAVRFDIVANAEGQRFVTPSLDFFHFDDEGRFVALETIQAPADAPVEGAARS